MIAITAVALTQGWLMHTVGVGAALLLLAAAGWRGGRWRPTLFTPFGWLVVVWAVHRASGGVLMGTALPLSVYLFGALPLLGLVLAAANWRNASWWGRAAAFVAIPLLLLTGLLGVNRWFGYYPTVESVFAGPPPTLSSHTMQLLALRRSGTLGKLRTGTVVTLDLAAGRSRFKHRSAQAWLPPVWSLMPRPRLPVLVLLHGSPGGPGDWVRAGGAAKVANRYATAHGGVAPILVFPDPNGARFADTECVDGHGGLAETYLTYDVPRGIVRLLGASSDPSRWGIGGLSEGGTCALTLTLRHPDVYRTFVDLSGDMAPNLGGPSKTLPRLYGGDRVAMSAHDPVALLSKERFPGVSGWFEAGAKDRHAQAAIRRLAPLAQRAGVDVIVVTRRAGQHNFRFWAAALADSFDWAARKVGAPAIPSAAPSAPSSSGRAGVPQASDGAAAMSGVPWVNGEVAAAPAGGSGR